ncbi:MAG: class I SAM-dependent methyltransferase [Candidatus Methanomethylicaceae archaeon]
MGNVISDLCIGVNRQKAESLRRALLKLGLLDPSRRIRPSNEYILIPILRHPAPDEFQSLEEFFPLEIIRTDLPRPLARPKNLICALDGVIPPYLLTQLPRSFDITGDIAVIEDLAPELIPYRQLVAKAIMQIHPRIKTVLLKVGKVEGDFRIPTFTVLAGEERYETIHTEYGAKLKVNLSKAYFSPRLASEHHRVASQVHDGEVVVDMFSGVGPFSILIAKKAAAKVFSIDINPYAISLLKENIKLNRLKGEVTPLCGDVRTFAPQLKSVADRVIMNLPESSLDYLDVAVTLLKRDGGMAHVYLFAKEAPIQNAKEMLVLRLRNLVKGYDVQAAKIVKTIAPREWQVVIDAWITP